MTTFYQCDTWADFSRGQKDYWRQVGKSEGFDIEGVSGPVGVVGLLIHDCQRDRYPDPTMIEQYGALGLHRYNMLEGTNFELSSLVKYNMLQNVVSSYYITLLANDPEASLPPKTFQVRVDERKINRLNLVVSVARPKKDQDEATTTKEPFIPHSYGFSMPDLFQGELPDWPSADALLDREQFYELEKSEWLDTAWISLYLKTLVYANDRDISDDDLSKLEILNVAIETKDEDVTSPNERLKAKSAHVYITFKGLAESFFKTETFKGSAEDLRLSEGIARKAVVRRVTSSGAFSLEGEFWSGQTTKKNSKKRSRLD